MGRTGLYLPNPPLRLRSAGLKLLAAAKVTALVDPALPTATPPDGRRGFTLIQGGKV